MRMLDDLRTPADLRTLDLDQLEKLAHQIREFLVGSVCRTGGHLGSNLGVVEMTLALHRVFDSPREPLVFDTGHQAYVHKLLTGRREGFTHLREEGGLSGYPNRAESAHDVMENSHASTALSYADGLAKVFELTGAGDRPVVAVVGDGALTGGLAWEGLNNLATSGRRVVVVVNDNGRSYSPTVGGIADHLARLGDPPGEGGGGSLFEALGFRYFGPVDGHDLAALESTLDAARDHDGPSVVHCRTHKGLGYAPALADLADHLHTVGTIEVATGRPARPARPTWTDVYSEGLLRVGERHPHVVAVTAAMLEPTGLGRFAERYPDRCFDVGIAEQHAVTSAAGLAMGGLHPVVSLYATFANRAFDQVLLDVGMHRLPVTFVLDRAGITGPDGPSHHGVWDIAMLGIVPGMRVAAPRDPATLLEELGEAVATESGPTALRYPKAPAGPDVPAVERWHGVDVLRRSHGREVLLVTVGPLAGAALEAADLLAAEGTECTVVDPRWLLPDNPALTTLACSHQVVVTAEDGVRDGGFGRRLAAEVAETADAGARPRMRALGVPSTYVPHGGRQELLARFGLDTEGVAAAVRDLLRSARAVRPEPAPAAWTDIPVRAFAGTPR